jgi:hypothetical protein
MDPAHQRIPDVVFVGGTGRSGTHVIAKLIGRHPRFAVVPTEVRFHVEDRGFPGLLAGRVTKDEFVKRMRGFWWKGFRTSRMRGLFRFVPEETFEEAMAAFEAGFEDDREEACRRLFWDLLGHRVTEADAIGLVEQSCDSIAAAETLQVLFPRARFIHVVRDGRDASASRVSQTRGLIYPRTRRQGLEWWEARIRRIEAGARTIPQQRLLTVSLDEMLLLPRNGVRPLCRFLRVKPVNRMRRFFGRRMSHDAANAHRWRRGLSDRRAAEVEGLYADLLERLEADDVHCAPLLRRTFERTRSSEGDQPEPLAYIFRGTPVSGRVA